MVKKILITQDIHPSLAEGLSKLGYACDELVRIRQDEVAEIIDRYDGIIVSTRIHVGRELIDRATKLRFIARAGSGMEAIDVTYAQSKGIICINSPEGNANSVGEHATGLLLAMFHNITKAHAETSRGLWQVEENRFHELAGRTLAIIGYGNTGKAFGRMLKPFSMNVIAYDKYLDHFSDDQVRQASMEQVFDETEILSLHVPLTEETREMVNVDYLQRFRHSIHLINTSRGKVINHHDLLIMMEAGKVKGAALDVFENENFTSHDENDHNLFLSLMKTGRVTFTPHIAGKSFESKKKIADVLVRKISALNQNVIRL